MDVDDDTGAAARCHIFDEGTMIGITFFPLFFEQTAEHQLSIVIHEHVHVLTQPLTQVWNAFVGYMPATERDCGAKAFRLADEAVTCELENVLFRLLS